MRRKTRSIVPWAASGVPRFRSSSVAAEGSGVVGAPPPPSRKLLPSCPDPSVPPVPHVAHLVSAGSLLRAAGSKIIPPSPFRISRMRVKDLGRLGGSFQLVVPPIHLLKSGRAAPNHHEAPALVARMSIPYLTHIDRVHLQLQINKKLWTATRSVT